jgi:ankyrin repeat protein
VPFTNRDGFHLLHLASEEGAHEVVQLLLDKGAPIDSLNSAKENALDIAIVNGKTEVIKALLERPEWKKLISHERRMPARKETLYKRTLRRLSSKPKTTR